MSEWLANYWFSLGGPCAVLAVAAYRLSQREIPAPKNPALWRRPSLSISVLLGLLPAALLVASTHQARPAELALQAAACFVIVVLFFASTRYSESLALFALLSWLSTSSVRPTRALWTSVYGVLFLGCAIGLVVTLLSGI
jgi:hypothetical protein